MNYWPTCIQGISVTPYIVQTQYTHARTRGHTHTHVNTHTHLHAHIIRGVHPPQVNDAYYIFPLFPQNF